MCPLGTECVLGAFEGQGRGARWEPGPDSWDTFPLPRGSPEWGRTKHPSRSESFIESKKAIPRGLDLAPEEFGEAAETTRSSALAPSAPWPKDG